MSYPPHYPPDGPQGPVPGSGPGYGPPPGPGGYGPPPPGPGYGPPPPKPPSTGGNTATVVIISVIAAGALLVIGVVGLVIFLSAPGGDTDTAADPAPPAADGDAPAGEPDSNLDGTWEGTLTQYDASGGVVGYFDVTVVVEGNEVVHAEETSEVFDYDLCRWDVYDVTWSGDDLYFLYEVAPEDQEGQSCAPTGDAEIAFNDSGTANIVSGVTSEGVLTRTS